jgi:two-component system nitrogen regulation sensor histidine kinase NtrY
MGSEKIPWKRILLLLIMVFSAIFTGVMITSRNPDYTIFPALITIISTVYFLRDNRKSEQSINQFFDAVISNDFSVTFVETEKNPSLRKLHRQMNVINRKIRELRFNSDARERYYRAVLQQSTTGLVVLNQEKEIEMINDAAARFAGISPASTDTRLMKIRNPVFFSQLCNLDAGDHYTYHDQSTEPEKTFLFRAIEIKAAEKQLKLISIENIRRELDHKELESYQSLIRILTHEIMNSVAPLTSVSNTLKKLFFHENRPIDPGQLNSRLIEALVQGLSTIDEQAKGLVNFVNNYRKLTRLPDPVMDTIDVKEWLEKLRVLLSEQLDQAGIHLQVYIEPNIDTLNADRNLLSQVIINLVNNARDALLEIPSGRELRIGLFRYDTSNVYIKVSNNGPPISPENLEKIFIPFFTTKDNGSGIGLYISRQIIHLHNGLLSVSSRPGETVFGIELKR